MKQRFYGQARLLCPLLEERNYLEDQGSAFGSYPMYLASIFIEKWKTGNIYFSKQTI